MNIKFNSLIPALPLVTLLLCSFNHEPITIHDPIDIGDISFVDIDPFTPLGRGDRFERIVIPPSKNGQNTKIYFSFAQDGLERKTISVYHLNPRGEEDTLLYSKSTFDTSYSDSFTYLEEYAQRYYVNTSDTKGPKFRFIVKNSSNTITIDKTCSTSYVSEDGLTNLYDHGINTSKMNIYSYSYSEGDTFQTDSFEFSTISNEDYYYDLNADNCVNLSYPLFKYNTMLMDLKPYLNNTPMEMYYFDIENLFPNIAINKVVTFKGKVSYQNDGYYHFIPETTFYIDPITRILYNDYKEGRILTNQLYFPLGAYEKLKDTNPDINMLTLGGYFGLSRTYITYVLRLCLSPNNLVGSCDNSEYCIQSSDSTPDFTIGTSKEN